MTLVLTEREGPVALVTMNRPERLNALNDELIGLVVDALEEADRDEDVRCIVLAESEKAFAAGVADERKALYLRSRRRTRARA